MLDSSRFTPGTWDSGPLPRCAPSLYCDFQKYDFGECEHWLKDNITSEDALEFKIKLNRCLDDWVHLKKSFKQSGFPTERTSATINEWGSQHEDLKDQWHELMDKFKKTQKYLCKLLCKINEKIAEKAIIAGQGGKDGQSSSDKERDTIQATPKIDSTLIYQADAATFYNIPKSTLSKASKKKSGELGYLWSGREGKRVFYRKSDCDKLARSRTKLRNV
ncbi:MAG: hypothetical protein GY774_03825 [Planctomycetes bacterium]|nr:hypothetical protein [Planctomycetota bacterium]